MTINKWWFQRSHAPIHSTEYLFSLVLFAYPLEFGIEWINKNQIHFKETYMQSTLSNLLAFAFAFAIALYSLACMRLFVYENFIGWNESTWMP